VTVPPCEDPHVGYTVFHRGELEFAPPRAGDQSRGIAGLSDAMTNMRANVWRYLPGVRGRRHAEGVQEEVFVVLEGAVTMVLGDPPEQVELSASSVAVVQPGTPLQVRNDGDAEAVVLIVGAPPETGRGEILPDAEP
jgi:mannose-6-phosphate isomerase-like protein (cupin superfamily)